MFKVRLEVDFEKLFFDAATERNQAQAVANEAKLLIDRHFETRQAYWRRLAAATMIQRGNAGAAGRALIQTGLLRRTASQNVTIESSERGTAITIESGAPYSGIHEFGRGDVPARPFLEMDNSDLSRLVTVWLEKF